MKTRWLGVLAIAAMTNACAEATEDLPVCEFCGTDAADDSAAADSTATVDTAPADDTSVDDTTVVPDSATSDARADGSDARTDASTDVALDATAVDDASDDVSDDTGAATLDAADSAPVDSGFDTGPFDTGPFDTGAAAQDTGPFDTGPFDTGTLPQDTGPFDTGAVVDTNTCAVDQTNSCGTCGRACSSTNVATLDCSGGECWSSCQAGHVNCSRPAAPAADDGCECEGTACCSGGTTCQAKHSNGIGDSWFDCVAVGTINLTQAQAAALAWKTTGTVGTIDCPSSGPAADRSSCWARIDGTQCSIWCYQGTRAGRVATSTGSCTCPATNGTTWQ